MKRFDQSRRRLLQVSGLGLAAAVAPGMAGATSPGLASPSNPGKRPFEGEWQFRQVGEGAWLSATVPGTVHTDLLAHGKIDDPFFRMNEREQQWIDKVDWEYRTDLIVDEDMFRHAHVDLIFSGLDTYADIYLNDVLILSADNMFREWTVDIKPMARMGANTLRLRFRSPINEGLNRLAGLGYALPATNDQSENGGLGDKKVSVFTRKAGYHYGWDWGPRFVTSGIWRPVYLRAWTGARIDDLHVRQDLVSRDKADLTVVIEILASTQGKAELLIASETDAIKGRVEVALTPGVNTVEVPLHIRKPKLWWSNGLGKAYLYDITARLVGPGIDDRRSVNVGLRTLRVVQTPDAGGKSFNIELNGVPVFMKGANYIPNDSFLPRVTPDVHERVVRAAADTHMNMLRVWGGGVYEADGFYDLCDRHGILVWQDFMFACSMYPGDEAFLANVKEEATQNVKRLRTHPSLALWCGNNEIDTAWQDDVPNGGWGWKQPYTDAQRAQIGAVYRAIFLEILPDVVATHDKDRFYVSSSPLAADGKHASPTAPEQSGDIHYWDVWWGQKPFADYRTHIGRFMSEYGFQSFPEPATVEAYTVAEDRDIFSDVMKAHQRSSIGNQTIKTYMARDYKVPSDFQQFLYVGQVLQAEGIKVAMEAHRSRMPYCMGSLFWQINDCWPVASWSSIDYFGRWKAQQYFARKAYAPVLVSPILDGGVLTVTVVNDALRTRDAVLTLDVMDFRGQVNTHIERPLTVPANAATVAYIADLAGLLAGRPANTVVLVAKVIAGKALLGEGALYPAPVKDLALPVPRLTRKVTVVNGGFAIAMSSPDLVKNLYLKVAGDDGHFDDNYFDILPGQSLAVVYRPKANLSLKDVEAGLQMMHMGDIR